MAKKNMTAAEFAAMVSGSMPTQPRKGVQVVAVGQVITVNRSGEKWQGRFEVVGTTVCSDGSLQLSVVREGAGIASRWHSVSSDLVTVVK